MVVWRDEETMRLIPFVRSHSSLRAMADAYADGELAPREAARFEAHFGACEECRAAVEATRALKASLAAMPEAAVPRSFRLTPAMVSTHQPLRARAATPGFLVVARVAAAASVAAFGIVATLNFSSTGGNGDRSIAASGSPANEAAELKSADGAPAGGDDAGATAQDTSSQPGVASPSSGGGVSGAGVDTPVVPEVTPAPSERNTLAEDTVEAGDGDEPPADAFSLRYESGSEEGTDYGPWLAGLAALSIAALATLAFMEVQRRRT